MLNKVFHALFFVQKQINNVEEVFDDIYFSFEIRVEAVSLMLHRNNNRF